MERPLGCVAKELERVSEVKIHTDEGSRAPQLKARVAVREK